MQKYARVQIIGHLRHTTAIKIGGAGKHSSSYGAQRFVTWGHKVLLIDADSEVILLALPINHAVIEIACQAKLRMAHVKAEHNRPQKCHRKSMGHINAQRSADILQSMFEISLKAVCVRQQRHHAVLKSPSTAAAKMSLFSIRSETALRSR